MKRIAIVVGHGPKVDKGAEHPNGTNELKWNRNLAERIANHLEGRAIPIIVDRVIERLQPVTETNATQANIAIELHCNSYNGTATGTEMIYHLGSEGGKRLATLLQKAAVKVLGLADRGIKGPQGGGRGSRWLSGTKMPAVIVESFFIDNTNDLNIANAKKEELAKAYADALFEA